MKQFTRTREDFICEHCGAKVKGDGYTNHCPHCLYSKHVDINPGDRSADCGGLMEPVGLELKDGKYVLVHRCAECGYIRRNKVVETDDFSAVLELSRRQAETLKY